jgi:hypothetical protein
LIKLISRAVNPIYNHTSIPLLCLITGQKARDIIEKMVEQYDPKEQAGALPQPSEKAFREAVHVEKSATHEANLVYEGEEEPELHFRTWIALGSMFLLNLVQVFALQGPPAVVSTFLALDKIGRLTKSSCHTSAQVSTTRRPRRGFPTHSPWSKL